MGLGVVPTVVAVGLGAFGPSMWGEANVQRVYALKNLDPKKPLAILVKDMNTIGRYTRGVSNSAFRTLKRILPGAYTCIFTATQDVPKIMLRKRKTIGVRMPDNPIVLDLLAELENPLLTTSIRTPDDDFINDPAVIEDVYGNKVDMVIDGGYCAW